MEKKTIGYWIATGLICLGFTFGAFADITLAEEVVKTMTHLGYPDYFTQILGVWKLLGVIALLAPGFPLVKEWAYAGITFDLTGAVASHLSVGDPVSAVVAPLVLLLVLVVSYLLRPDSRRLSKA